MAFRKIALNFAFWLSFTPGALWAQSQGDADEALKRLDDYSGQNVAEPVEKEMIDIGGLVQIRKNAKIDTFEIIAQTAESVVESSCIDYCITGLCVWLRCSGIFCSVETSLRVKHRNPDLVVSVYKEVGQNPWREIETLFGEVQEAAANAQHAALAPGSPDAGGGESISTRHQASALTYREVDAIGHPINLSMLGADLFCGSQTVPFVPVFFSAFDSLSWRLALPEYIYGPLALPGVSTIGTPIINDWGNVYLRHGFTLEFKEPILNALMAQRVGSIITQDGAPHIYTPLTGEPAGYKYFQLPSQLTANSPDGGVWQMLSPKSDNQCVVFGQENISWADERRSDDGGAVFNLWRPYECCRDRGSLITSISIPAICL